MKKKLLLVLVIIIVVGGVAGGLAWKNHNKAKTTAAKPDATLLANTPAQAAVTNQIQIKDMLFNPATVTMKVGSVITWTNNDTMSHTVTADTPSADAPASQTIAPGKTYSFTFNKAGTYAYHCSIHPSMQGTITITE